MIFVRISLEFSKQLVYPLLLRLIAPSSNPDRLGGLYRVSWRPRWRGNGIMIFFISKIFLAITIVFSIKDNIFLGSLLLFLLIQITIVSLCSFRILEECRSSFLREY